jgi:1-acyl-sn-glycerol-3-phosphate acyltransferase
VGDDFSPLWAIGSILTVPIVRMLFRLRVEGIDRVPASGPTILAFNHVSVLDGPALAIETAVRRHREVRFLAAAELFDHRVFGPILRSFDQIPIRRGMSDTRALGTAIETVRAGAVAAIAPEGRVSDDPGSGLQRIRSGCARIALPTGAPVIPVGIWGTQRRWPSSGPKWAGLWRRVPLAMVFGPAVRPHVDDDIASFGMRVGECLEVQVRRARALA